MKNKKLPYHDAELSVTDISAGDVIATSGESLKHVESDPGSWV